MCLMENVTRILPTIGFLQLIHMGPSWLFDIFEYGFHFGEIFVFKSSNFLFNKNDCSEWVSIIRSPVSESPTLATCLPFTVFPFFLYPKSKIPAAESIFPLESKFALTGKEN